MKRTAPAPRISAAEMDRRQRAVDQARAANIWQGYTHDPLLEAINDRFIRGDIDLATMQAEVLALVQSER